MERPKELLATADAHVFFAYTCDGFTEGTDNTPVVSSSLDARHQRSLALSSSTRRTASRKAFTLSGLLW